MVPVDLTGGRITVPGMVTGMVWSSRVGWSSLVGWTSRVKWRGRLAVGVLVLGLAVPTPTAVAAPAGLSVQAPRVLSTLGADGDATDPLIASSRDSYFFSTATNLVHSPPPTGGVYYKRWVRAEARTVLISKQGSARIGGPFRLLGLGVFSAAKPMVPQDTNSATDIYMSGIRGAPAVLLSRAPDGRAGNGATADFTQATKTGWFATASAATNLVAGDRNGKTDIFGYSAAGADPVLVSARPDGGSSAGGARAPSMSGDGRYVTFLSTGSDLVAGMDTDGGAADLFVRDLLTGRTRWLSKAAPPGVSVEAATLAPDASRVVQRWSDGTVRLTDRVTGIGTGTTTTVAGAASFGRQALGGDGRLLAYVSTSGHGMVADLTTGATRLLTAKATGGIGNGAEGPPSLDPNGTATFSYAVFSSTSTNLVAGDVNGKADVYRVLIQQP